ncbi:MAG: DNA-binding protein [Defluviitaleaceae bacterium]|nr:DNA-binding protein [Defluviitaleaceae bacterium]
MTHNLPEARQHKNLLYDFYGALLTKKQNEIYAMHHEDDNSLAEIGSHFGITPQAVADTIKRANGKFNSYEEKLGLVKKFITQQKAVAAIEAELLNIPQEKTKAIRQLVETLLL